MKPFRKNLKLVIKIYLYGMYDYFPGVVYSYNDVMLSGVSNSLFHLNTTSFELVYMNFSQMCLLLIHL